MTSDIRVLTWDRQKHVRGLNRIIGLQPSFLITDTLFPREIMDVTLIHARRLLSGSSLLLAIFIKRKTNFFRKYLVTPSKRF